MKILIIENDRATAYEIATAIKGLGDIVVCTSDESENAMPPEEDVVKLISSADVVLLDHELGGGSGYTGYSLLPHCVNANVIGISNVCKLGGTNFHFKDFLPFVPARVEQLRALVTTTISSRA